MSTIFLVDPALTLGSSETAHRFFTVCKEQLAAYVPVSEIRTETSLRAARPGNSDAIIVFNRPDTQYNPRILDFLGDSVRDNCVVVSVAMTADSRRPPQPIENRQCFDVTENLRRRSLEPTQVETIAATFSRQLLATLEPTLTNEPMNLFLSYRRIDGEEIASSFYDDLLKLAQTAFRDLISVRIGEDAQTVIEGNLSQSDALIFLDTPKSGTSPWIEKELQIALSLNLPVVWLRVGPEVGRSDLRVKPASLPHFVFPSLDPLAGRIPVEVIDRVVQKAFEISREIFASRVFDQIQHLRRLTHTYGATFTEIDKSRLLYSITLPRREFRYPQRPITQVLQFFGRWPTQEDRNQINPHLKKHGYEPHPKHGPYYDTALLLAPVPTRPDASNPPSAHLCLESSDDYVRFIESYLVPKRSLARKGVIISGAFPDCEPDFQQYLTDAVHAFSQACLGRRGTIIFGAHPTFQHLIFDMAKRRRPEDFKTALHLYVSRFFATDAALEEYSKYASIFATEATPGRRDDSLTAMRLAMINDPEAVALVAIGGKTTAGGHSPGVDEEIALARKAGIPVFVIGSVGGRSGQLAAEWKTSGEGGLPLNPLSDDQNEQLRTSVDYVSLAAMVLDFLGL